MHLGTWARVRSWQTYVEVAFVETYTICFTILIFKREINITLFQCYVIINTMLLLPCANQHRAVGNGIRVAIPVELWSRTMTGANISSRLRT